MISVLRVDDRLLHGQVAAAWVNHYQVDVILIANEQVITDVNMQTVFRLATPPGVTLSMKSPQGAVNVINNPKHAARKIMVIAKTMQDAAFVCANTGGAVKSVLLGGLRSGPGKKQIDMNSYMDAADIEAMDRIAGGGAEVFMQADPTSRRLSAEEIRKSFQKA